MGKVTLRGEKMYEFLDRLVNLALPRVRDFRGVNPNAFDGRGNFTRGTCLNQMKCLLCIMCISAVMCVIQSVFKVKNCCFRRAGKGRNI